MGLRKVGRPALIDSWISKGRTRAEQLKLAKSEYAAFGKVFWSWWKLLQPDWRQWEQLLPLKKQYGVNGEYPVRKEYGNEWNGLRLPGPNRMTSVMAALMWWGEAVQTEDYLAWNEWMRAVVDVSWVCDGLVAAVKKGTN